MSNNLPIKAEKNNIFKKIISLFKKIFAKEEIITQLAQEVVSKNTNKLGEKYKVEDTEFISKVSKEKVQETKLEEIVQIIEKDPKTLEKLSIEKLEIIDQYYIEKINEYKNKLTNAS